MERLGSIRVEDDSITPSTLLEPLCKAYITVMDPLEEEDHQ